MRAPRLRARPALLFRAPARATAVTVFVVLLLPGSAAAALDVSRDSGILFVTGATSDQSLITIGEDDGAIFVSGSDVAVTTTDPACVAFDEYVECGDADATSLELTLAGDGEDEVEIDGAAFAVGATVHVRLGSGDDRLTFSGDQRVVADLGAGDDVATTGSGNDTVVGGAGDDRFVASTEGDGEDTFIGGADTAGTLAKAGAGDTVDYSARTTPVTVVLAPDDQPASGDNGSPDEDDHLGQVENVTGARSVSPDARMSALVGNERPNVLTGGLGDDRLEGQGSGDVLLPRVGKDVVDGGNGNDVIDARNEYWFVSAGQLIHYEDVDERLSCGAGEDAVRGDLGDPGDLACEHAAPFLADVPRLVGTPQVGHRLSIERGRVYGEATGPKHTWYSCPATGPRYEGSAYADPMSDDCTIVSRDDLYTLTTADLGRRIFGRVDMRWAFGEGDTGFTSETEPITAVGAAPPGGGGPPILPTPGVPLTPFTQAAARQAQQALGAGAFASGVALGSGTAAFEARLTKTGTVTLRGRAAPAVAGIACERACTLVAKATLVLVPKARSVNGRRATYRTVRLRAQTSRVRAGDLGVVRLRTTPAQRRLIKRAKKAKISFALTLKYADGTIRRATKSYLVKVR